ncbi:MAG: acyl carrier protein [Lentisphaeria bacterium]|jgi:acyl carrier protein|nr:acyl carrier protein [Lentisphaeria bacterium]
MDAHPTDPAADLRGRLIALLADVLQVEITPEMFDRPRHELDAWDSVNHLRFIQELEEAFGVSISDEEAIDLLSLRQAEHLLTRRGVTPTDGGNP